ncbi:ATP-dependent DNA helicase RecG [bacterium]|nr:ATP-dependent DNA helicase RecG [bacterium]
MKFDFKYKIWDYISMLNPDTSIQYIKGVGPKRVALFERLGIQTVKDLLYYIPRRYEDRSDFSPIARLRIGEQNTVVGKVLTSGVQKLKRNLSILKVAIDDGTGIIYAVWFNQPFLEEQFKIGTKLVVSGKVQLYGRKLQISSQSYEILRSKDKESETEELIHTGRIVPFYPLTQDISQRRIRRMIKNALDNCLDQINDMLSQDIKDRYNMVDTKQALLNIHFPETQKDSESAYRRIVFDEFLLLQLGILLKRASISEPQLGIKHQNKGRLLEQFLKTLPFKLTDAQHRVIDEINRDMTSEEQMNRLIQGEVGSGKTIVAIAALLISIENDYQGAIMAPTEILAEQHYITLAEMLSHLGIKIDLLIGSTPQKSRVEITENIRNGITDIIIGTHTLVQENIKFKRLGLIVIDEQHRFGVMQRNMLRKKGLNPDVLVMTATPIPRTLALTVYGDLDISTIRELPPGRGTVSTYWVSKSQLQGVYEFIEEEIKRGRQAYVVSPLIEESHIIEAPIVIGVTQLFEHFKKERFPNLRIGLLHGQMKNEDKEKVMQEFRENKINILVSTTVIEVGIDIPNATIMLIENAERFGLSQLHQLRGRIGRGRNQSYCILHGMPKTPEAQKRMTVMTQTQDGFRIAQEDLEIRGPGEFFGTKQHGLPELKIGNIILDIDIMEIARKEAVNIIKTDPELSAKKNYLIKRNFLQSFKHRIDLVKVG